MYKHIIIPVALDHESDLEKTIATARMLQPEGGKITLVAVLAWLPRFGTGLSLRREVVQFIFCGHLRS